MEYSNSMRNVQNCNKTHLVLCLAGVLVGVLPHGARLGVVVRRVGVEVAQVFRRVLPDPQVPHSVPLCGVHLGPDHVHLVHVLILVLVVARLSLVLELQGEGLIFSCDDCFFWANFCIFLHGAVSAFSGIIYAFSEWRTDGENGAQGRLCNLNGWHCVVT